LSPDQLGCKSGKVGRTELSCMEVQQASWTVYTIQPVTARTANEGPVKIHYKCLVPIYDSSRNETVISKTELECSVSQFLHSDICERFIDFKDQSAYSVAGKYVDQSWEYINRTCDCGNWDRGRAISRKGIHKWGFPCSAAYKSCSAASYCSQPPMRRGSIRVRRCLAKKECGVA
jgi:hypothetical protein